jgi:hypothetical protein
MHPIWKNMCVIKYEWHYLTKICPKHFNTVKIINIQKYPIFYIIKFKQIVHLIYLPKHCALLRVKLCITRAPKKDHFNRNAEARFLKDLPFCLLGWKQSIEKYDFFNKNEDKNHQNKIKKMLERGKIDTPNTTAHFILLVHALQ